MSKLKELVRIEAAQSKSVNVELSVSGAQSSKFVPTSRSLETIDRIVESLTISDSCRSFAITGPYGSGKSSFAVFLRDLISSNSEISKSAKDQLRSSSKDHETRLDQVLKSLGYPNKSFTVGMATAMREPVGETIRRSLMNITNAQKKSLIDPTTKKMLGDPNCSPSIILSCVSKVLETSPLLLVLDEFGKNLEAFKDSSVKADLFILQQLAELAQSHTKNPLLIITLKHLAFNEYSSDLEQASRRELAKVQGRFEEIMFVENPAETRRLVAELFKPIGKGIQKDASKWVKDKSAAMTTAGLSEVLEEEVLAKSFPLHPMNLACLPELCSRFAQNDRTLFAYLGSGDPRSVATFIEQVDWNPAKKISLARLDHLYDYFVESVSTSISTSDLSSRWIEIETRIRDTAGLSMTEVSVLKTIGILNLISAGGVYRASRDSITFAIADCTYSDAGAEEVRDALKTLLDNGVIVYRDFADEFRIWIGTDYPLQEKLQNERSDARVKKLDQLLEATTTLAPLVASRHSQSKGVLRIFDRRFGRMSDIASLEDDFERSIDGHILLSVEDHIVPTKTRLLTRIPVLVAVPQNSQIVMESAVEVFALTQVSRHAELTNADWIARREIAERLSHATTLLMSSIQENWLSEKTQWYRVTDTKVELQQGLSLSSILSSVCDEVFSLCPEVRNEMIARREVTGQGARARRLLSEAMLLHSDQDRFAIEGFGPERSIYEAVFRKTEIHKKVKSSGSFEICVPPKESSWFPVAHMIKELFDSSKEERLSIGHACEVLQLPPYGLKMGLIPLLLLVEIFRRGEAILLYEHGSLVTQLDDAIAERMIKNPNHFSVKCIPETAGSKEILSYYTEKLFGPNGIENPTIIKIGKQVFSEIRILPKYALGTREGLSDSAIDVRSRIREATELDVLLLEVLPGAVNRMPIDLQNRKSAHESMITIDEISKVYRELMTCYPRLLERIQAVISTELKLEHRPEVKNLQKQTEIRAKRIIAGAFEPNMKALAGALLKRETSDHAWLEHVAMVVAQGRPPFSWDDDQFNLFQMAAKKFFGLFLRMSELAELEEDELGAKGESVLLTITGSGGSEMRERFFLTADEVVTRSKIIRGTISELETTGLSTNDAYAAMISELVRNWKDLTLGDKA